MKEKNFNLALTIVLLTFLSILMGITYGKEKLELHQAIMNGDLELASKFISEKIGINAKDKLGVTPLMLAAEMGQLDIVRLLIDNGANIESQDSFKWTALMYALRYGHIKITELLIENGADVYKKNGQGWTTMMIAAAGGNIDIVKMLIEKGININKAVDFDYAACVAFKKDHDDVGKFLFEKGAKYRWPCSALTSPEGVSFYATGKIQMFFAEKCEESGDVEKALKHYLKAAELFEKATPKLMNISEKFGKGKKIKQILFYGTSLADSIALSQTEPFEEQRIEYAEKSKKCQEYYTKCKENIDRLK